MWNTVVLEDVASPSPHALSTGPFGSAISSRHFLTSGVPVIRGSNLSLNVRCRLLEDDLAFLSDEKALEFKRSIARRGDLVFTCWGTVGQVGLIDARAQFDEYVISNKQMKLTPDPIKVDSLFLYYRLSAPDMVAAVRSQAIGSAVPGFNLGQLRQLQVSLPRLDAQRRIAGVLGAFDDLIATNARRIWVLEETVRTLHYELFDSSRSGLSESPTPEFVVPFGQLCKSVTQSVDPGSIDPSTPAVGLEHLPRRSTTLVDWGRAEDLGSRKLRFEEGDVLFGKIRPYFHKVAIAPVSGVCSTDIIVLRPERLELAGVVSAVASSDEFVASAVQTSNGTKMPRADWKVLSRFPVVLRSDDVTSAFSKQVLTLTRAASALGLQNRSLSAASDVLLPGLVTGQVDIESLRVDDVFGWAALSNGGPDEEVLLPEPQKLSTVG